MSDKPGAENSARTQRGRPFLPGQSGNPAGKPKGTRNRTTRAVEVLLDGDAEALTRKLIDVAKSGDVTAMRLCFDRIAPPRKDRHIEFELPPMTTPADAVKAAATIAAAVADGELTPSEAADLSQLVANYVKAIESTEIEARLQRLEAANTGLG